MLQRIEIAQFRVPFRRAFSHASATRTEAENVIVAAFSNAGVVGYGEGCPRDYVTGETVAGARRFIAAVAAEIGEPATELSSLRQWIADRKSEIDQNPAAFAALEIALLDMMARERGVSVEALLGLPSPSSSGPYTAVIGTSSPTVSRMLWLRYRLAGLRDFKVKLSGDLRQDRARLAVFRIAHTKLRLDANNLWRDPEHCIEYMRALNVPAFALEEPLSAGDIEGCRLIARRTGLAIILDESFLSPESLATLGGEPWWIVNIRVSKQGGILRSLAAVSAARACGIGIIVGAHVGETGLLSRAAMPVARAAGDRLLGQEGAFGTYLLVRDLVEPSPRFGFGGRIPSHRLPFTGQGPGLGLDVDRMLLNDVNAVDVARAEAAS